MVRFFLLLFLNPPECRRLRYGILLLDVSEPAGLLTRSLHKQSLSRRIPCAAEVGLLCDRLVHSAHSESKTCTLDVDEAREPRYRRMRCVVCTQHNASVRDVLSFPACQLPSPAQRAWKTKIKKKEKRKICGPGAKKARHFLLTLEDATGVFVYAESVGG